MIISHKYKFIYFAGTRTASTTFQTVLAPYLGEDDIFTGIIENNTFSVNCKNHEHALKKIPQINSKFMFGCWNHMSPFDCKMLVTEEEWDTYKKVTTYRDPYDRLVSMYYCKRQEFKNKFGINHFRDYIDSYIWRDNYDYNLPILNEWLTVDEKFSCDLVLKFDNFDGEFQEFLSSMQIDDIVEIPHLNANSRRIKNYNLLYDNDSRMKVYYEFIDDIIDFGKQPILS